MNILVCDDDRAIVDAIEIYLSQEGYTVVKAYDGLDALKKLQENEIQLVLMDVMMPGMDGIRTTMKIRETSSVPIIFLSAKSEDVDKILGLNIGADDYIIKPFDSELLIFKIKAILSRCEHEDTEVKPKMIELGAYLFNTELRTITKGDEVIKLTPKESRLLELLYYHKDGLLQRDKALNEIWGASDYFTARSMDVYVTKLRKYFKDDSSIKIENVHGSGFRLILE